MDQGQGQHVQARTSQDQPGPARSQASQAKPGDRSQDQPGPARSQARPGPARSQAQQDSQEPGPEK
ncbi:hypothetical protein OS493_009661, partial [Desmophyllum pertusum]